MENSRFLMLNDIDAYISAFHLSNVVWKIIVGWDYFAKDTVGKQFVRAVDSISANIAEGLGRYHKKDKIHFNRIAQGSLKECFDWNEKAKTRQLLTTNQYNQIFTELNRIPRLINQLIQYTNSKLEK